MPDRTHTPGDLEATTNRLRCPSQMRLGSYFLIFCLSLPVAAQSVPDTEVVLAPVFGSARGEFGSIWSTSFLVRNDAERPAYFRPLPCVFEACPPGQLVPPHTSFEPPASRSYDGGALFYVEKATASLFSYDLHTRDTSRQSDDAGVQIPVVRERDVRTDTIVLPNVPLDALFRQRLRIYDIDAIDGHSVRVAFYGVSGTEPVASVKVSLVAPVPRSSSAYPIEPGFAFVTNWTERFPTLRDLSAVRIEITPLSSGLRFWAFVTITNNTTQHVTIVSPQ
jgi:hypothetical protein